MTIRQAEVAAGSRDPSVHTGLIALLERRLEDPRSISLDLTLEVLVALMRSDDTDAAADSEAGSEAVVAVVKRCATEDSNEEVRYLALDVLKRREGPDSSTTLAIVSSRDPSDLVREHAVELLAESANRP